MSLDKISILVAINRKNTEGVCFKIRSSKIGSRRNKNVSNLQYFLNFDGVFELAHKNKL